MVEFSSPNTNKPLHLGHLRNDALGYSLSKILEANGAQVKRVNIINDRGIHICKSMLAYQLLGKGKTPESERIKPDHFVGNYYVLYDKKSKEDSSMEQKAREMLKAWEEGDREVTGLWKQMNGWAIDGINETYRKTGIWFDKIYFESETYLLGKEEVLKGLKKGVFYKKEDGSVWVNLSELRMDNKVLLRGDGTSLYVTQDIGTAILRYNDWPFNKLIYIVGSEQKYHFQVLFNVLKLLGFPWAGDLYHLSYGMVNLPEGKMKSREGTVVDADDLLNELKELAKKEIEEKGRVEESGNIEETAEKIALGALNYYLLQTSPNKDMLFNPAESISFNGNTGPYLQYTGARIASIFRKYEERKNTIKGGGFQAGLLAIPEEGELIMLMAQYPEIVLQCAEQYNPSIIANHLYEIASTFNTYYHENQIINNKDSNLVITRLSLARGIQQILKNGFDLLGIPFLECM
jgi:arginyl-tRNA synthetase